MAIERRQLLFEGEIVSGAGKYAELEFPGKEELPGAPEEWPESLCPGSLNVMVLEEGYPAGFDAPERGGRGVQVLDDDVFAPSFFIPGALIGGNMLLSESDPRRGSAQVWRAILRVGGNSQEYGCWVVRRLGSRVGKDRTGNVLEIMSDKRLRHELGVGDQDGERVSVVILEGPSNDV